MRAFNRLFHDWPMLLASGAALGALALLWHVREMPLQPAPSVRVDALGAFFIFALLVGMALTLIARQWGEHTLSWRTPALAALLIVAWSTTLTAVVAGAYLLFGLLTLRAGGRMAGKDASGGVRARALPVVMAAIGRGLRAAPDLVAAGALIVGYGALATRGALHNDERTAGSALDSFVFWFVLLAAIIPISGIGRTTNDGTPSAPPLIGGDGGVVGGRSSLAGQDLFRIAWFYPLVRLYSLGPWNSGWSFATLLLGGAAALWAAISAIAPRRARRELTLLSYLGLALAGLGLGTSAGIAAGCYGVLTFLILASRPTLRRGSGQAIDHRPFVSAQGRRPATDKSAMSETLPSPLHPFTPSPLHWLLSGAIPFTAPFVAAWMIVGAGVAGGVALLSGVAWLVVLLNALTTTLGSGPGSPDTRRPLLVAAATSAALGIAAPLVVSALIQPVIEQLQGGLTPYGDVNIWPWIGLTTIDAAHTQVTTLPSIAVAALMLVLSALVYLIVRLHDASAPAMLSSDTDRLAGAVVEEDRMRRLGDLLTSLRDEVPWLGARPPQPAAEERSVDGE
jgi:hypothetical protein